MGAFRLRSTNNKEIVEINDNVHKTCLPHHASNSQCYTMKDFRRALSTEWKAGVVKTTVKIVPRKLPLAACSLKICGVYGSLPVSMFEIYYSYEIIRF